MTEPALGRLRSRRADSDGRAGAALWRSFIEHAPAAIAMFDREMRYLVASRRWIEMVCEGRADVIGLSHYELVPDVPPRWKELHRRALSGETLRGEDDFFQRQNGRRRWVHWELTPWRDAAGAIGGIIIFTEDVTAKVEHDEAQRKETKALARLHDAGWGLRQAQSLREGLDEILAATIDLLGAERGEVQLLESDGTLRRVAQRGLDQAFLDFFRDVAPGDVTACGRALHGKATVLIEDVERDESYGPLRGIAHRTGYRAVVAAPLIDRFGTPVGVLSTYFAAPHRPSEMNLQHLDLYRRRGADFIERFYADEALRDSNAKLAAETRAMARFYDAGAMLWQARSIEEGLDGTLAAVLDLLGADMGNIQLLDARGKVLRFVAQHGFDQKFLDFFAVVSAEGETSCSRALRTRKTVVIADIEAEAEHASIRAARQAAGYRAVVSAPLVNGRGDTLGMLSAHFRAPHRPSDPDLQWLELYRRRAADFIERLRAAQALTEGEERLRLALASGRMAMFDTDLRTGAYVWNDECYRVLGYRIGDIEPSFEAWAERIHPADRAAVETSIEIARRERRDYIGEFRIVRTDGSLRWVRVRGRYFNEAGELVRFIGLVEDNTELRQHVETQRVLVAELQHRTRNLMAVVQSIAHQTLDTATSIAEFQERFDQRLEALSRVQSLLSRADNEPITLGALVAMELEAIGADAFGGRIAAAGPDVALRKRTVEMLSLAIHELATNAIKYGALAGDNGRLSVTWRIAGVEPDRRLVLEWRERGLALPPPSAAPKRRGFGRSLIEQALPYSLSAETSFELGDGALRCVIGLPLVSHDVDEVVE